IGPAARNFLQPRWFWSITLSFGPASTESECSGQGPSRGIGLPTRRLLCRHSRVGFGSYMRREPLLFFCGLCWQVLEWLSGPQH
ncbi:MAG: hypothetical protein WB522_15420, partial [Pseudolabrys sp.]